MKRVAALLIPLLALQVGAAMGRGIDPDERIYLRVMAQSVPVHSGPGGSFREIGRIGFGQVYLAQDRSQDGCWYRIRLTRGVTGWVLAELVWPFEIADEGALSEASGWLDQHVFGASLLRDQQLMVSLFAGILDTNGLFGLRLGYQPSRYYAFEIAMSQSPTRFGNTLFYLGEMLISVGPWRTFIPFLSAGAGGQTSWPQREAHLFHSKTYPLLSGGGGFLVSLQGISARIDVRRLAAFSSNSSWGHWVACAGLAVAF